MKAVFSSLFLLFSLLSFSQRDTTTPLYKRFPTLPPLQLILTDSTKYTSENVPKKKPVLILFFSPDCEHCQHETEELVSHKENFKNIHIIMVSTYPLYRLKEFADKYGLMALNNVTITKDPYYFLLTFYNIHNFPYLALYNKKGALIETFEGTPSMDKVLLLFETNK